MSLWLLDTDHTSLFLIGVPTVRDRIVQHSDEVAISIVTVQESFNGWITQINDPLQADHLVDLYTRLWLALDYFKSVRVCNLIGRLKIAISGYWRITPISIRNDCNGICGLLRSPYP